MPMPGSSSRQSPQDLHIVALLSTERGRRSALLSSVQCLLSVVGSMGIILLFAGIPQLIYSPVVTVTNVVTFLMGALLLSVMVAGNACISYKFRAEIDEIRGVLRDSAAPNTLVEDKPPSYEELSFGDALPPDYYSVVSDCKDARSGESSHLVEVVPTHGGPPLRLSLPSCSGGSGDNLQRLWQPSMPVEVIPRATPLPPTPRLIDATQNNIIQNSTSVSRRNSICSTSNLVLITPPEDQSSSGHDSSDECPSYAFSESLTPRTVSTDASIAFTTSSATTPSCSASAGTLPGHEYGEAEGGKQSLRASLSSCQVAQPRIVSPSRRHTSLSDLSQPRRSSHDEEAVRLV